MAEKKRNFIFQFIKFNIIGLINTILTFLIYSFLIFISFHHFLALSCEYVFGIFFSFYMNKIITFKDTEKKHALKLLKMTGSYAVVYALNFILLFLLIDMHLMDKIIYLSGFDGFLFSVFDKIKIIKLFGQFAAMSFLVPISFFFQKYIVFINQKKIHQI